MNVDSINGALSHISNLVGNLTKKNYNSSLPEITEVLHKFGGDAEQHLYRVILKHFEWLGSSESRISLGTKSNSPTVTNGSVAGLCVITTGKEKELASSCSTSTLGFSTSNNNSTALILLVQHLAALISLQRFASHFAVAISDPFNSSKVIRQGWVSGICKLLKLTRVQEVVVCIQLLNNSVAEIQNQAIVILRSKLPELIRTYIEPEHSGQEFGELSTESIHLIFTHSAFTRQDSSFPVLLTSEQAADLISVLKKKFSNLNTSLILLPIIYPKTPTDTSEEKADLDGSFKMAKTMAEAVLTDALKDVGFNFCSSNKECKAHLSTIGSANINPRSVALALGYMITTITKQTEQVALQSISDQSFWQDKDKPVSQTERGVKSYADGHMQSPITSLLTGTTPSWNVEVFMKAIAKVCPSLNDNELIAELDYGGFFIRDRHSLSFLFKGLRCLLQEQGYRMTYFPTEYLYQKWKHSDEQLALISQILRNSDVFCFTDYSCSMALTDGLKSVPEPDNKELYIWKSLPLIELLLMLAEVGHYAAIKELLKFPMQHCPDILILSLAQISLSRSALRLEVISSLLPIYFGSNPNSSIILHNLWNVTIDNNSVQKAVMVAMSEWYMVMEYDQTKLSRILDIAQDLKALPNLLNSKPYAFIIDLACLAYRREYLKLDKWLPDKVLEYGDAFVTACVTFLQNRCPQLVGKKVDPKTPQSNQLPKETISTMVSCLHSISTNVSQEISDTILTMVQNCSVLARPKQMSLLGFPGQGDGIGNLASNLGNLAIGGGSTASTIFPSSASMNISVNTMGAIGSNIPLSSPARPLSSVTQVSSSQQPPVLQSLPPLTLPTVAIPESPQATASAAANLTAFPVAGDTRKAIGSVQLSKILELPPVMPKEAESEANSYFQKIYNLPPNQTLAVEEALDMLGKFQHSKNKREKMVYLCMLKNLFEEYRYFPSYPLRELVLTARLFGGMIDQGFVECIALGIALRFVMESIMNPHGCNMYYFGLVALDKFRKKMKEYPRYCLHITSNVEHFNQFPAHLIEYLNYGAKGILPPHELSGECLPASVLIQHTDSWHGGVNTLQAAASKSLSSVPLSNTEASDLSRIPQPPFTATGKSSTNIETLLEAEEKKISPPPENKIEKIAFIFNNLSQINLAQKCEELKEELVDEYWEWVAQYVVMKRASIENNFHTLYALFLDQLRMPPFNNLVVQETLRNVKVLLRADKSTANLSDKSLLKNLGHWLGMLTLAKSKPILHIDIDMKSLLVEAYRKGLQEMQYVVPFVAKVIECCSKSKVFKPPNPWTMAIMNVLAELHAETDMKLHLKFEIEVLCNKLEILLKDLVPSNTLKNSEKLSKITPQLSPPGGGKRAESTPIMPGVQDWHLGPDRRMSAVGKPAVPKDFHPMPKDNLADGQRSSAGATPTSPVLPQMQASITPTPIAVLPPSAAESRYSYKEINVNSLRCIDSHLALSNQTHNMDNNNHQIKQIVRHGIETGIQELTSVVVERSIKVAITTSENLIKKDFALEPDERNMRTAAHHLVRNLTAAHVLMTARDHILQTIAKYVKQSLLASFSRTSPQHTEQVDQYSHSVAQECSGIVCAFMQKTSAEKAVLEMDKIFAAEYEGRKVSRSEGKRYYDSRVYSHQMERIPDSVRLKVGNISQAQMLVYQEFGRNIPGFLPRADNEIQEDYYLQKPVAAYREETTNSNFHVYTDKILLEVEQLISALTAMQPTSALISLLHSLQEGILMCRTNGDSTADQLLIRRCVENLLEAARDQSLRQQDGPELQQLFVRFRDVHLLTLKAVADMRSIGALWTSKFVAKCWMESREDIRYNLEAFDWLLKTNIINIQLVDEHLARCVEEYHPLLHLHPHYNFIVRLVQNYLVENTSNGLSESDLPTLLEKLLLICPSQTPDSFLSTTMEALKFKHDLLTGGERITANILDSLNTRNTNVQNSCSQHFTSGVNQAKDFNDPPGLHEKTEIIFRHWAKLFHASDCSQPGSAFQIIVKEMDVHGILKTDELITRFFRIALTLCRDICIRSILETSQSATHVRNKCFPHVDAFVRLIASLVKQSGEPSNPTAKINLLNKVLGLICGIMLHDIETSQGEFHQLPYHRLLIMLFLDLNAPETVLEAINLPVLMAFTQTLHLLRPSKCPGFAYAWLEIVSHRVLIGRMLAITPAQKGWAMYSMLLTDLFKFLAPFLKNVELAKPFTTLYKGTLRVLLVLLHDFPEFLCEFHFIFCDSIPPNCIQMRNLILSAYPRKMRLPDPFMPNLRVDRLTEITIPPKMHTASSQILPAGEFKDNVDAYLKNRAPVSFLSNLRSVLQVQTSNESCLSRYNVPVLNALVLYVGTQAIEHIQSKNLTPSMATISHSAHMDIFENLAVDLDTEGRYLFLVAIANQLRYPNSHTHYFSCTLLYLFSEANTEAIQEQITRVLLERLIGNRPQPWGLLITFIELLKNPTFKFWTHDFVKCAPEIEKIFESVARSCCVTKNVQQE